MDGGFGGGFGGGVDPNDILKMFFGGGQGGGGNSYKFINFSLL